MAIAKTLDVDLLPPHYQFVRGDGLLVGSKGEGSILASRFLPCITLMPTPESPIAAQVKVTLWSGACFYMWALPSCAFAQLRTEASRFWGLNPADTVLLDRDGAAWPDAALVHEVLAEVARAQAAPQQVGSGGPPPAPLEEEAQRAAARAVSFILRLRDSTAERALDPRAFRSQGGGSGSRAHRRRRSSATAASASAAEHRAVRHRAGGGERAGGDESLLLLADGLADDPFGAAEEDFASSSEGDEGEGLFSSGQSAEGEEAGGSSDDDERVALGGGDRGEEGGRYAGGRGSAPRLDGGARRRSASAGGGSSASEGGSRGSEAHLFTPPPPAAVTSHSDASPLPSPVAAAERLAAFAAIEPRCWRVFTWYACAGDSGDPFHVRARQWRCLLDDCGLLTSSTAAAAAAPPGGACPALTPEVAYLIFRSAVAFQGQRCAGAEAGSAVGALGGHPGLGPVAGPRHTPGAGVTDSPVGLGYVQFLRALVAVARRLQLQRLQLGDGGAWGGESPSAFYADSTDPAGCASLSGLGLRGDSHSAAIFAVWVAVSEPKADALLLSSPLPEDDAAALADPSFALGLVGRRLRSSVAMAFMELVEDVVAPRARSWSAQAWRAEAAHLRAADPSGDASHPGLLLLDSAGSSRGAPLSRSRHGTQQHSPPLQRGAASDETSAAAVLAEFAPALRPLFDFCELLVSPSQRIQVAMSSAFLSPRRRTPQPRSQPERRWCYRRLSSLLVCAAAPATASATASACRRYPAPSRRSGVRLHGAAAWGGSVGALSRVRARGRGGGGPLSSPNSSVDRAAAGSVPRPCRLNERSCS